MTREEAEEVAARIERGDDYRESIFEGSIEVAYVDGAFLEHDYQHNPYGGPDVDKTRRLTRQEIVDFMRVRDREDVMRSLDGGWSVLGACRDPHP